MGLSAEPQSLHDLHGLDDRIEAKDIAGLIDDIASMPVSGRPFARLLHAKGEDRIFRAEGRIAEPELVGDGGVVVWVSAVTAWQSARDRMAGRVDQMSTAPTAISALNNAAPVLIR